MMIKPKWNCPNCPMSSTRHWNVLRHINRWHAGLGRPVSNYARQYRTDEDPQSFASSGNSNNNRHHHYGVEGYSMKAESSTSNNNNPTNSQFIPEELDNDHHTHERHSLNEPSPSSFSTAAPKKEGSQNTFNKLLLEFNELLKLMPPGASSQQSATMNDIMVGLLLRSLFTSSSNSNNNIFQKNDNSVMNNNNNNNEPLPAGYRIQFCNTCLPGNRLEPISAPFIIFEALTKIHHRCETEEERLESLSSTMEQQNAKDSSPYTIKQAQERLISYLREVFIIRVGQQQGGAEGVVDVTLKAHDYIPEPILGEKLPQNRSWIEESDYIDLGNISNIEQEKNWVYRLVKEGGKGTTKIIKINKNEFTDFVNIAKATFGAFKVQLDDDATSKRYFLIFVEF
jgi:hypothetical protein